MQVVVDEVEVGEQVVERAAECAQEALVAAARQVRQEAGARLFQERLQR